MHEGPGLLNDETYACIYKAIASWQASARGSGTTHRQYVHAIKHMPRLAELRVRGCASSAKEWIYAVRLHRENTGEAAIARSMCAVLDITARR